MGQHFLLSSKSRTFSLKDIYRMSEKQAFETFKKLRWKDGKPICPKCGCDTHYYIKTKNRFQCKVCKKQYTVTSGTIFAYHKLTLQDYLSAIAIFVNGAKGYTMIQLSKDLDVQYKTAFVLAHKIREAILNHKDIGQFEGEIEIDGTYIGGYVRPENEKKDRVDRRKKENQSDKKRCIISVRQRGEKGAKRTLTFVTNEENQKDINEIAKKFISKQSTIFTDEHDSYNLLHASFKVKTVNHKEMYSKKGAGININQCESFFSRLKRSHKGIHHKFGVEYLLYYAEEMAFREDNRRVDNGTILSTLVFNTMHSPVSNRMCGYWQRKKK